LACQNNLIESEYMSTDSIFENKESGTTIPNNTNTGNVGNTSNEDELTHLLAEIKNERGEAKYKSLKDALVGLQNAQAHIPKLNNDLIEREKEIERLRKESERIATLEESIKSLTEKTDATGTPPKALSAQEIADLVNKSLDSTLSQREAAAQAKQNQEAVVKALVSKFGDKAEEAFNEAAADLGMSVQEFNTLAAKNPKLIFKTLGITSEHVNKGASPQVSSVNSAGFTPNTDSNVGRNKVPTLVGATSQELQAEQRRANEMVAELHKEGKSVHDFSDPKVYFKRFG
jgi:ribosomal protein L17